MAKTTRLNKLIGSLVETKSGWDSIFLRAGLQDKLMVGDEVMEEPYNKHDLVYICISTTQRAVSQVPIVLLEKKTVDGEEKWEPVSSDNPLQKLLDETPNPLMDPYTFKESIVGHFLLDGDVFVVPFPPKKKVPDALYVVTAANMEPIRNKQTGQLDGWLYMPKGARGPRFELTNEEVLHFKLWNPNDQIMGLAPLEAAKLKIKTDYKATVFNERFFDNAAVPHGVLSMPGRLTGDRSQRLKEQVNTGHQGYKKAHRLLLLEEGLQYTQMGLSHKEMQFAELSRLSRESIMQCFGMKKSIISVIEDVNRATAEAERKEWWKGTIIPMLERFAFGFTHRLAVPMMGAGRVYVDFDTSNVEALQEDFKEKVEIAKSLAGMGFTANEINQRLELGFDMKTWRDKWWAPYSLVPVGEGDEEQGGGADDVALPSPTEEPPEIEEETYTTQPKQIEATLPEWEKRAYGVWKAHMASVAPVEENFEKKVTRFFYELRQRALRHLLQYHNVDGLRMELFEEERKQLAKWVRRLYTEAVAVGMRNLKAEVGDIGVARTVDDAETKESAPEMVPMAGGLDIDFMMADPIVAYYIDTKVTKITDLDGLTGPIKRQIHEQLAIAQAEGETLQMMADRVREVFNMAETRAKTIARTEVIGSANMGRDASMRRTGFRKKIWYTAADERVRKGKYDHVAMNGETIDMHENWVTPSGSALRYPGDYQGPAGEIINCRCSAVIDPESHPAFDEE